MLKGKVEELRKVLIIISVCGIIILVPNGNKVQNAEQNGKRQEVQLSPEELGFKLVDLDNQWIQIPEVKNPKVKEQLAQLEPIELTLSLLGQKLEQDSGTVRRTESEIEAKVEIESSSAELETVATVERESEMKLEEETSTELEFEAETEVEPVEIESSWTGSKLTKKGGVNDGPSGTETWYDLRMNLVVDIMYELGFSGEYWIREDGVKMFGPYVMVAANVDVRPKGTILETSLGMAMVCDECAAAYSDSTLLDIAVNWKH